MKFLVAGIATALMTSASVALASSGLHLIRSQGIGLLYHGCFRTCEPDPDLTITNNSGRTVTLRMNGQRVVVQPHHEMEFTF